MTHQRRLKSILLLLACTGIAIYLYSLYQKRLRCVAAGGELQSRHIERVGPLTNPKTGLPNTGRTELVCTDSNGKIIF